MYKLVSVIMSTYNESIFLLNQSIRSILNQSYQNIELIIVIDNPNNLELQSLVEDYGNTDSRIKIIKNISNIGLAKSLNNALNLSHGEYIARMDADDMSVYDRLKIQVDYLDNHPECDIVCGGRINIDEEGKYIFTSLLIPLSDEDLAHSLTYGSIITHPTIMIRSSAIKQIGGYHNYPAAQDYDLWLRLRNVGIRFHYINEILLLYRVRSNSISSSKRKIQNKCAAYAKRLSVERIEFSEEKLNDFLSKNLFRYYSTLHSSKFLKQKLQNVLLIFLPWICFLADYIKQIWNSIRIRKHVRKITIWKAS